MCEILLLNTTDNSYLSKLEIDNFLTRVLEAGYSNPDGYGILYENGYYKRDIRFDETQITPILQHFRKSRFFILHTRLATSKINYKNTHPVLIRNNGSKFLAVHNGVVNVYDEKYSKYDLDSLQMFYKISDQKGAIPDKIKHGMRDIGGSYSCFIYDYSDLYYYRDEREFTFMFNENENRLYGATNISRLDDFKTTKLNFFNTSLLKEPDPYCIYKITIGAGDIIKTGDIEREQWDFNYSHYKNKRYFY